MENNKQKAIELAYGQHWDKVKDFVDENGWFENGHQEDRFIFTFGNSTIDFEYKQDTLLRPKSISGIETNNNWISIHSEDDLPKENYLEYFVKQKENEEVFILQYADGVFMSENNNYENITHYQQIIKPEKPIY